VSVMGADSICISLLSKGSIPKSNTKVCLNVPYISVLNITWKRCNEDRNNSHSDSLRIVSNKSE
jgi:hypothetical protein